MSLFHIVVFSVAVSAVLGAVGDMKRCPKIDTSKAFTFDPEKIRGRWYQVASGFEPEADLCFRATMLPTSSENLTTVYQDTRKIHNGSFTSLKLFHFWHIPDGWKIPLRMDMYSAKDIIWILGTDFDTYMSAFICEEHKGSEESRLIGVVFSRQLSIDKKTLNTALEVFKQQNIKTNSFRPYSQEGCYNGKGKQFGYNSAQGLGSNSATFTVLAVMLSLKYFI
jgi:hypothetical protein